MQYMKKFTYSLASLDYKYFNTCFYLLIFVLTINMPSEIQYGIFIKVVSDLNFVVSFKTKL